LDLSEYTIISKLSCIETREGTNEPRIIGGNFKVVHFALIDLPIGRVIVPEDILALRDPVQYHRECCRHWEVDLECEGQNLLHELVAILEEEVGVSDAIRRSVEIKWRESYLSTAIFPPCPCGLPHTVRERREKKLVRLSLQCSPTCAFSKKVKKSWYRRPYPHCMRCKRLDDKVVPLMKVDSVDDGMGITNLVCEVCHTVCDKMDICVSNLLTYLGKKLEK